MTDLTAHADIDLRLNDLTRSLAEPKWTVARAPGGGPLPFYALYQRRFWAVVIAAISEDTAVAYLTAKPHAIEDPLVPGNALQFLRGTALECLKAGGSYMAVHERQHMAPYGPDFERANRALREFVANVVDAVSAGR
jgi:hypothetical protein